MNNQDATNEQTPHLQGERRARAILSGIVEPGDEAAQGILPILGAEKMVEWAAAPFDIHPDYLKQSGAAYRLCHNQLHLRFAAFDLEAELAELDRLGGRIVIPGDPDWPTRLDGLGNAAPFALWALGTLPGPATPTVAITGARAATRYGTEIAEHFARDLAATGTTVVSGGAYGIDTAAHRGALSATKAAGACTTVAVLAGGLKSIYPAGNDELFQRIVAEGGAIIAEVPPTFRPARWRFLERNRLVAALSDMTVIVEGSPRSGAVATALKANELGREVGAVPGPITSNTSVGCHQLIAQGAALITGVDAITETLEQQRAA